MNINDMIEVLNAARNCKELEYRSRRTVIQNNWAPCRSPAWDFINYEYRVKPEPKLVAFTVHDIKKDMVFIHKACQLGGYVNFVSIDKDGIRLGTREDKVSYYNLKADFLYSLDEGKTWNECSKEVNTY